MSTVQKRGESYRITASAGYDSQGKQIRRSMTWRPAPGMTEKQIEKELERQKVLFEDRVKSGQYMDGNVKFQDFAERWFEDYGKEHLRNRTYYEYQRIAKRVYEALGHIRIDRLRPHHLLEFYKQLSTSGIRQDVKYKSKVNLLEVLQQRKMNRSTLAKMAGIDTTTITKICQGEHATLRTAKAISSALDADIKALFEPLEAGKPLAPKTIMHYHAFISSVMERAVKWQMTKENPCRRIDAPKVARHQINCLNDEEAAIFLQGLDGEPLEDRVLFSLALYTGMRRGELLGLEWPDISLETGVITIRRTSQYSSELGTYTDDTKTEQSKRSVRVTQGIVDLLRSYKAEQAMRILSLGDRWSPEWSEHPRLFTNQDGRPMSPSIPLNRLKRLLKRLELREVSLHSLRHTSATLLIQQGVNIRTVSGRLGHSQTSTTMNIYAHQLQSADAAAAEALDLILTKKKA